MNEELKNLRYKALKIALERKEYHILDDIIAINDGDLYADVPFVLEVCRELNEGYNEKLWKTAIRLSGGMLSNYRTDLIRDIISDGNIVFNIGKHGHETNYLHSAFDGEYTFPACYIGILNTESYGNTDMYEAAKWMRTAEGKKFLKEKGYL